MNDATQLVQLWKQLVALFALVLTQPGLTRFHWITETVLGWEVRTITQILTSIGLGDRWRVIEHFAEYVAFRRDAITNRLGT